MVTMLITVPKVTLGAAGRVLEERYSRWIG